MIRFIVGTDSKARVDSWAFPYTTLQSLELETAGKLVLRFVTSVVTVEGKRLGELFRLISEHKASELQVTRGSQPEEGTSPYHVSDIKVALEKRSGVENQEVKVSEAAAEELPPVIELPPSKKRAQARRTRSSSKEQKKAAPIEVSSGVRRAR